MSASRESEGETIPDDLGRTVGGYRLVRRLGVGGMGAVYLGAHPTLPRKVAVKVILPELAGSAEMRRRFLDEARLVASLHHPSLVEVLDLAELDDGRLYMVMEYLEGEPLSTMMKRRGALPVGEAAAIALETLRGVAAAHAGGVLHRDIKPHNLYVVRGADGHGKVKVLDFGLAKVHAAAGPGVTRTGAILGTPGYMAPEQAAGTRAVDARADVYAVGVVLYEMLAGKPPFDSDDWVELLHMHRTQPVPALESIPADVAAVVQRALAKRADDRYESAVAMADALAASCELAPVPAPELRRDSDAAAEERTVAGKRGRGDGDEETGDGQRERGDGERGARARAPETRGGGRESRERELPPTRMARVGRIGVATALVGAAIAATAAVALWPRNADRRAVASAADDGAVQTVPDFKMDTEARGAGGPPLADAGAASVSPTTDAATRQPTPDARIPSSDRRFPSPDARSPSPLLDAATSTEPGAVVATDDSAIPPDLFLTDVPSAGAFDFHARIPWATTLARRIFPDARLVHINGSGLLANGTFNLNAVSYVAYTFRSPARSVRGSRPRGDIWACLVSVTVRGSSVQVGAATSECNEPYFTPRCDGRELWAIAAARGAETDRRADLYLYPDGNTFLWKLRPDESYDIDDAECAR